MKRLKSISTRGETGEIVEFIESSGNVFADLGLSNPEERLLKSEIAIGLENAIDELGWTQTKAAEVLGISQPQVSDIFRGRLRHFSVERLLNLMAKLDYDISIHFEPKENSEIAKEKFVVSV